MKHCPCGNKHFVSFSTTCGGIYVDYKDQCTRGFCIPKELSMIGHNNCGESYIDFKFCPECGRIQGEFPVEIDLKK